MADRRDEELTEQDRACRPHATSFRIAVVSGPDQGKEVTVHASSPGPVRVGGSPACELVLADRKVSRRHASLECVDGALRIADLASTNGTRVNGVGVEAALLLGGETVHLGDTSLWIEAVSGGQPPILSSKRSFGRLLGASVAMRRLYPVFERLAASDVPVVVEGETGTGKELLAEALHEQGPRHAAPFVVVEVTASGEAALEQELFGVEGGEASQRGAFEEAHQGTLLIDDVAELSLPLQARLLRAIDRKEVLRVHGTRPIPVDVRIIVATRHDLDRAVENGTFREDLFHHLAVGRVELPPLRRREEDLVLLADHFWREMDRDHRPLPSDILRLDGYRWPGNVRELKNAVTRRLVLGRPLAPPLRDADPVASVNAVVERALEDDVSFAEARERAIAEFERVFVGRTLERYNGNVTRAAAASGLARRYFHRLKARHLK